MDNLNCSNEWLFIKVIALAVQTDKYFGYPQPFKCKNIFFEQKTSAIRIDEEFIQKDISAAVQTAGIFFRTDDPVCLNSIPSIINR